MGYSDSDMVCPYYKWDEHRKDRRIIVCEAATVNVMDRGMMKDIGYTICCDMDAFCPFREALNNYCERKKEPGN
jgi:hypothetical protein